MRNADFAFIADETHRMKGKDFMIQNLRLAAFIKFLF